MILDLDHLSVALPCFLFLIYYFFVYRISISPLSKIPNAHPTSPISPLWILRLRFQQKGTKTIHEMHKKRGPVLRVSPNEVSVNCVKDGVLTIYPAFEKPNWYDVFRNYGIKNMVSMTSNASHSARKRILAQMYSKSYLQASPHFHFVLRKVLYQRLITRLSTVAESQKPLVDTVALFEATSLDIGTGYVFGLAAAPSFIEDKDVYKRFADAYYGKMSDLFWRMEFPTLTRLLRNVGLNLSPPHVYADHKDLENLFLEICDRASEIFNSVSDAQGDLVLHENAGINHSQRDHAPLIYMQLRKALEQDESTRANSKVNSLRDTRHYRRLEIASELLDLITAGFDTSSTILQFLAYELSKTENQSLQEKLRAELRSLEHPIHVQSQDTQLSPIPSLPSPRDIDALPLLNALVLETLRLYNPAPSTQPRVSPPGGCLLGSVPRQYYVPGGVRVSAQSYSLHRNEEVFPDSEAWKPERWLHADREMHRWFWAFGSGRRGCIGEAFAMFMLKFVVAAVYTGFKTTQAVEGELAGDERFKVNVAKCA